MPSRLYTLLLVVLVVWSSLVAFESSRAVLPCLGGVIVTACVFALAAFIVGSRLAITSASLLLLVLVVVLIWLSGLAAAPGAARRMHCAHNLQQISLALTNYQNRYGSLPPAYVLDKDGKPMHSWRVLILPCLGYQSIYSQYDFDERWDGPHNKELLAVRPAEYVCPCDKKEAAEDATHTSYVAVVGSNAAWRGDKPTSLTDPELREHASTTIILAETADAGVNWTEPEDLSLDALESAGSSPGVVAVSSKHGCYHEFLWDYEPDVPIATRIAFVDGSNGYLPSHPFTSERLIQLLRIGGYKKKDVDSEQPYRERYFTATLRWRSCIALAVWLISVSMLLYHSVRSRKARV